MEHLISVIVPVYNVAQYLDACVESIVNQTYKNLEIILVDDGSPDMCPQMCDAWAEKDKRIKVIHQKNGGLSAARNAGIAAASGEYIGLVDSDDYVDPRMYERMYAAIQKADADLCICGMRWVNDDGSRFTGIAPSVIQDEILTKEEAFPKIRLENGVYYVTTVNKLYKKKLFDAVKFPVGRIHEDEFTIHLFLDQCRRIACVKDEMYFYVQRSGSITNSRVSIRKLDVVRAFWERYMFFKEKGIREEALEARVTCYYLFDFVSGALPIHKYWKELAPWMLRLGLSYFPRRSSVRVVVKFFYRLLRGICKAAANHARYCALFFGKKERVVLLATPVHGNLGDQAIVASEREWLARIYPQRKVVEVPNDLFLRDPQMARKYVKDTDIVVIDGGGNLGTLWPHEDDKITEIISLFSACRILVFPQTCYYDPAINNTARLMRNRAAYSKAERLTVMLRDRTSYEYFREQFPNVHAVFVPDIVLSLQPALQQTKREGALLCFRSDCERVLEQADLQTITRKLNSLNIATENTSTLVDRTVTQETRQKELQAKWEEFASARLVITDRLHAMIFAAITGTPCIALDNKSKKVSGVYEWLKDLPYIYYCETVAQVLEKMDAALCAESDPVAYRFPEQLIFNAIKE